MKKVLSVFVAVAMVLSITTALVSTPAAMAGTENGMHITLPTAGSNVTTNPLLVSGTFDSAQPQNYTVSLTVNDVTDSTSNSYTYTLPATSTSWGPISIPASDFGLATDGSVIYNFSVEGTLEDATGVPVPGIDTGLVSFTWQPSKTVSGGELRIGLLEEPTTLFSCLNSSTCMFEVLGAIESGMVGEKPDGTPYPDMLTEVPSTDNGDIVLNNVDSTETVTYRLKHNLEWSDGYPVTSYDVKFSWEMMENPAVQVVSRDFVDKIESLDTPDDYTVVAHFNEQTIWAKFGFEVYPSHILEPIYNNNPADINTCLFNTHPVYAGPYMLDSWVKGQYITVVKNLNYWDAANMPNIDRITFFFIADTNEMLQKLENGDIHYTSSSAFSIQDAMKIEQNYGDRFNVDYVSSVYWEHLTLNMDDPIVGNSNDPTLRQALMYALDRQAMSDQVFDGKRPVCNEPISPQYAAYVGDSNINLYPYDPTQARNMLQNARYTWDSNGNLINPNGQQVVINIEYPTGYTVREQEINFMKNEWWNNLGVTVNLVPKNWGPMFDDWYAGNFQAALFAWGSDPNEIINYTLYNSSQIPTEENGQQGQNFTRFRNADVDTATNEGNSTIDEATRINDSHIVQELVNQYLPELYLNWHVAPLTYTRLLQGIDYSIETAIPDTWNCNKWRFTENPPSAPSNLNATVNSDNSITLTWNASTAGDEGHVYYNIYRGTAYGSEDLLAPVNSTPVTGTTFADNPGTGCFVYKVQAIDGNAVPLRSDYSNEVTAINGPPATPSLVSPANNSSVASYNEIKLEWDDVVGASSYEVQVSDQNDFSATIIDETGSDTYYTIPVNTLQPAKAYYWRVRASNSYDASNWSDTWMFITMDAYENDDTPSNATLITVDGTIQHHNFDTAGDVDWIKFNAEEGKTYTIDTLNLGSNCNTRITLYAPDGTTFIDYNDYFDGSASRIDFECPQGKDGTYYIKVQNCCNRYGANTNYDIRVYPAIKISFSDSNNGGKDFGIAKQDNNVTVTVTQDGNPLQNASVYCGFDDGSTKTTGTSGQVTFNVNSSWDGNTYFEVTYGNYKRCYDYFWVLNSNDALISVKPKDRNGYYLRNYDLYTHNQDGYEWWWWSSYHNATQVLNHSGTNVVIVEKSNWDTNGLSSYYMVKQALTTALNKTVVPFDAQNETRTLNLTGQFNGNPLSYADVELRDEDFNYTQQIFQGYTDSSGKQTAYVTPGHYTIILRRDNYNNGNPDVVLMDTNVSVSSDTNHTVSYTSSQLGTLNSHAYDGNNNEIVEHYLGGYLNNCWVGAWSSGESMLLIPGTYQWAQEESSIGPYSNRWEYFFIPTETSTVTAGSTQEVNFGGPLTMSINFDKPSYNPGDTVNIKVPIVDHYEHYLDWMYHYSSSSSSGNNNSSMPNKNKPGNYYNEFMNQDPMGQYHNPNLKTDNYYTAPSTPAPSSGWEYPNIHLTVKDPNSNTVVDTSNYSFWSLREYGYSYTLPSDAPNGTYTATATLNVGPYNNSGIVTKTKTFTVQSASPLAITTTSLPNGTVGASYSATLQASGGTGTYTWSITSGNLPDGLSLNSSTGVISGTPTTANTYNFTVQVSDGTQTATKGLSIIIQNNTSPSGMHITSPALNSTIATTSFQVSGTFDADQPAGYTVSLDVFANSKKHTYTYTLTTTGTTWGPITVKASDFGLVTDGSQSYATTVEGILLDGNGVPVTGIDTGSVSYTWKPGSTISLTIHLTGNKYNLVSFPFEVNPSQIPHLVKAYTFDWSNYWQAWEPNGTQEFTTFEPGKGYWVKVSVTENVTLTGSSSGVSSNNTPSPSGTQNGMTITSPTAGSTVTTNPLSVSGTFDTAQPAGYTVSLDVSANSQEHTYTYTLTTSATTWGPITVKASDFGLVTDGSQAYSVALEGILENANGMPVTGIDTGSVSFTWKPYLSFTIAVTPGKFNLIGNPFNTPISLSSLNQANGNHIVKVYTFDWTNYWQVWTPDGEQQITTLEPGRGYWIQLDSNASTTFTFPAP